MQDSEEPGDLSLDAHERADKPSSPEIIVISNVDSPHQDEPISNNVILQLQAACQFCGQLAHVGEVRGSQFSLVDQGLLVLTSLLYGA